MTFRYTGTSRELRKIIVAILKSGLADNVKRLNYVQNYTLKEKNIEKSEEKIVLVHSENQEKLLDFFAKNFPQMEKINVI